MQKTYCDRCSTELKEEVLGDAVMHQIDPGDEENGPQFLMIMSADFEGEPDRQHYCKTCTTLMLDQAFVRDMSEAVQGDGLALTDGDGSDKSEELAGTAGLGDETEDQPEDE